MFVNFRCRKTNEAFDAVGDCSIDLPPFFVKILPIQVPVKNRFKQLGLAPEHGASRKSELAVSFDMTEIESLQESVGFAEVAIFMAPAGIMFDPEAEGIIFNGIDNARLC